MGTPEEAERKDVTITPAGFQMGMELGIPTVVVTSSYSAAAATAASAVEASACLAAEKRLHDLELSLVRILADEKDSQDLRRELGLDAIEPRVVRILAGGELERRSEQEQHQKWLMDKWIVIALAAGGWLVALAALLFG